MLKESVVLHGIGLKYFVEVARTGSLAAASQQLHVAVSAISRQIAKLEEQVGTPLFER
ncbi:LysR family regulatory protein, partial [Burkholderia pseudomallei 354a]